TQLRSGDVNVVISQPPTGHRGGVDDETRCHDQGEPHRGAVAPPRGDCFRRLCRTYRTLCYARGHSPLTIPSRPWRAKGGATLPTPARSAQTNACSIHTGNSRARTLTTRLASSRPIDPGASLPASIWSLIDQRNH